MTNKPNKTFQVKGGFSLVEVLVALGILSIMALAMATMMANQSKDFRASDEKLGLQNTQLLLTNVLSSSAFCRCFIGANNFDYQNSKTWNTFPTEVRASYTMPACAGSVAAILTVGTPMGSDVKIVPTSMVMQNIVETTSGSGIFTGDLVVGFDQAALTRSRKPITIPMGFKVNMSDPPAAAGIESCSSVSNNSVDLAALCTQLNGFYNTSTTPATCDPTYQ